MSLKIVRKYCLEYCCLDQAHEVRLCPSGDCVLWPLRFGKNPENRTISSLKAIREKCLDCSEGRVHVVSCPHIECVLYPYRFGKRPTTVDRIKKRMSDVGDVAI